MTVDTNEVVTQIRDGDKIGILIYLKAGGDPNARSNLGWTLLHIACLEGQAEIANIFLEFGATVNACTTDMSTPLHRACAQGYKQVAEILLDKNAYVNAQDKFGNTPLHLAAKGLHTAVVKLLIERKADRTKINKKNHVFTEMVGQQLMSSVETGDTQVLSLWLDWGLSPDTVGNLHWSLLHHASARGQLSVVQLILDRNGNPNILDSNKNSPLHSASFHGHKEIVKLLIKHGANLNAQDQRGNTPLHSACFGGRSDVIQVLLEHDSDIDIPNKESQVFTDLVNELLVKAVQDGRMAHVVSFLKGRANPNTRDAYGTPVLCYAAFKDDLLITEALLEAGADPNLRGADTEKTALHHAAAWGNLFVLKALLDKGAELDPKDKYGSCPLHEAAREGVEDVITVLIGRRACLSSQDSDGNTPLHIAAKWGQTDTIEQLIENGARVDIKNKMNMLYSDLALIRAVRTNDYEQVVSGLAWGGDPKNKDDRGWTILHHAVYKDSLDICKLLLECGADVNAKDPHGRTPLLLAAYRGNHEIMEVLLNVGADINCQDRNSLTPLHWAANEGSIDTVQMLLERHADRSIKNKHGLLYTNLLLKHLYLAVRHNDLAKVVKLVAAGADQFAVLEGTGVNPRDEAKRRGFFPILQQMSALAMKDRPPKEDKIVAVEDIHRLFEDEYSFEDDTLGGPSCSSDDSDLDDDSISSQEEEDLEDDAYWKMRNAVIVLDAKDVFSDEEKKFWKHWEEKKHVITAKELLQEELETFWESWEEKPKILSAKEFFNDDKPWWESDDEDEKEVDEGSKETDEEEEDNYKPTISAKEFFNEDQSWWAENAKLMNEFDKDETWKNDQCEKGEFDEKAILSVQEFVDDENREWWQSIEEEEKKEFRKDMISVKDLFRDEESQWWQTVEENNEGKLKNCPITLKELLKDEKSQWLESFEDSNETKHVSANESFKEGVAWWESEHSTNNEHNAKEEDHNLNQSDIKEYNLYDKSVGKPSILSDTYDKEKSWWETEDDSFDNDHFKSTDDICLYNQINNENIKAQKDKLMSAKEFYKKDKEWWKSKNERESKTKKIEELIDEWEEPSDSVQSDTSIMCTASDSWLEYDLATDEGKHESLKSTSDKIKIDENLRELSETTETVSDKFDNSSQELYDEGFGWEGDEKFVTDKSFQATCSSILICADMSASNKENYSMKQDSKDEDKLIQRDLFAGDMITTLQLNSFSDKYIECNDSPANYESNVDTCQSTVPAKSNNNPVSLFAENFVSEYNLVSSDSLRIDIGCSCGNAYDKLNINNAASVETNAPTLTPLLNCQPHTVEVEILNLDEIQEVTSFDSTLEINANQDQNEPVQINKMDACLAKVDASFAVIDSFTKQSSLVDMQSLILGSKTLKNVDEKPFTDKEIEFENVEELCTPSDEEKCQIYKVSVRLPPENIYKPSQCPKINTTQENNEIKLSDSSFAETHILSKQAEVTKLADTSKVYFDNSDFNFSINNNFSCKDNEHFPCTDLSNSTKIKDVTVVMMKLTDDVPSTHRQSLDKDAVENIQNFENLVNRTDVNYKADSLESTNFMNNDDPCIDPNKKIKLSNIDYIDSESVHLSCAELKNELQIEAETDINFESVNSESSANNENIATSDVDDSPECTADVSRESSVERSLPKEDNQLLHKTIWRCNTYDAISLNEYDTLSYMVSKSKSFPANWRSSAEWKSISESRESLTNIGSSSNTKEADNQINASNFSELRSKHDCETNNFNSPKATSQWPQDCQNFPPHVGFPPTFTNRHHRDSRINKCDHLHGSDVTKPSQMEETNTSACFEALNQPRPSAQGTYLKTQDQELTNEPCQLRRRSTKKSSPCSLA